MMAATTVWPIMALPSRRTPMRAFDRPTVGCGPSAPAPGRIRGIQTVPADLVEIAVRQRPQTAWFGLAM